MFYGARGEVEARKALLLALLCTLSSVLYGCRSAARPTARYTVRLNALLPLHPAWSQVAILERAEAAVPTNATSLSPLPPPLAADTRPFNPPTTTPANLTAEREKLIQADAQRYIDRLIGTLQARADSLIQAKKKAEDRLAATEYKEALAAKAKELQKQNTAQAQAIQREITPLEYRMIALDSQYEAFTEQLRRDANLQRKELQGQIDIRNEQVSGLLDTDVQGLAEYLSRDKKREIDAKHAVEVQRFVEDLRN